MEDGHVCSVNRASLVVAAALLWVAALTPLSAQIQRGEIFGKVTDSTGAVLPGVTSQSRVLR